MGADFCFFPLNHAEHYQVSEQSMGYFLYLLRQQKVSFFAGKIHSCLLYYSVVLFFFCPTVDKCPRVCFSLISVVLVVVYQPGK